MSKVVNVILSGGSGTRLWPLSRESRPKQFLQLFNGRSLFQNTLLRNRSLVDEFMIVTNTVQIDKAVDQADQLSIAIDKQIVEPVGRNTAAAIALACLDSHLDDILFITPSDQMITEGGDYNKTINRAVELAEKGYLVTFGIKPIYPETGFGYIEHHGENVLSFREKPDDKTAELFLSKGNFLWNSGMFCFKARTLLEELFAFRPNIYSAVRNVYQLRSEAGEFPLDEFQKIPAESIDYAVLEKSEQIKVVLSTFPWTDLGSFKSLIDYYISKKKIDGLAEISGESCSNSYAFSRKKVYAYGINNIVMVETDDCILVLPLEHSKQIKNIYELAKSIDKQLVN